MESCLIPQSAKSLQLLQLSHKPAPRTTTKEATDGTLWRSKEAFVRVLMVPTSELLSHVFSEVPSAALVPPS